MELQDQHTTVLERNNQIADNTAPRIERSLEQNTTMEGVNKEDPQNAAATHEKIENRQRSPCHNSAGEKGSGNAETLQATNQNPQQQLEALRDQHAADLQRIQTEHKELRRKLEISQSQLEGTLNQNRQICAEKDYLQQKAALQSNQNTTEPNQEQSSQYPSTCDQQSNTEKYQIAKGQVVGALKNNDKSPHQSDHHLLKQQFDILQNKYKASEERQRLIDEDNKQKSILYTTALEQIHKMSEAAKQLQLKHTAALKHSTHVAETSQSEKQEVQNQLKTLQGQHRAAQMEHKQLTAASQEQLRLLQAQYNLLQIKHAETLQRNQQIADDDKREILAKYKSIQCRDPC